MLWWYNQMLKSWRFSNFWSVSIGWLSVMLCVPVDALQSRWWPRTATCGCRTKLVDGWVRRECDSSRTRLRSHLKKTEFSERAERSRERGHTSYCYIYIYIYKSLPPISVQKMRFRCWCVLVKKYTECCFVLIFPQQVVGNTHAPTGLEVSPRWVNGTDRVNWTDRSGLGPISVKPWGLDGCDCALRSCDWNSAAMGSRFAAKMIQKKEQQHT